MRGVILGIMTLSIFVITPVIAKPLLLTPEDDIQQIIDNSTIGSTIILSNGTYNQSFIIKKPINIYGMGSTVFNMSTGRNKPVITISASNVSLYNLSISNSAPGLYTTGICITGSHTIIENCIIHDTPIGISIWSSYNTIRNCYFYRCKDEGIVFIGSSHFNCSFNILENCSFKDNCDAIEMQHASNNKIIRCSMINNTHSGIDAIAEYNNKNIIMSCTISNNSVHGIYLSSSSNNIIANCKLYNNGNGNIVQTKNSSKNIIHNIISPEEQLSIQTHSPSTKISSKISTQNHPLISLLFFSLQFILHIPGI